MALSLLVAGARWGWRGLAWAAVLLAPGISQLQHRNCPPSSGRQGHLRGSQPKPGLYGVCATSREPLGPCCRVW